jgi:bisanhydrobacterioruberin hydratase
MNHWGSIRVALALAYAFLWAGGIVSYSLWGGPPEHVAWTAPLFLALAGALVFAFTPPRQWHWLAFAAGIGFASEIAGVLLGIPYGGYHYTDVLGPKLLGVPLVLTTAWLVLVAYVQHWMARLGLPEYTRPFAAAAWMTAIDFVIDPLAAGPLGYWSWQQGGFWYDIPWTNFLGWYLVSLAIFLVLPRSFKPHRATRLIGASVILFFGVIAFALGMAPVGAVALALLAPEAVALSRDRRKARQR